MLVLHRKPHERVMIRQGGKTIAIVELTDCGRGFARLGLTADREIEFIREELIPKKEEDNRG